MAKDSQLEKNTYISDMQLYLGIYKPLINMTQHKKNFKNEICTSNKNIL